MQLRTSKSQKELKEHGSFSFPVLVSHETLSSYDNGFFLWHWHPEIELTYVVSGEIMYQVNQDRYHLGQGMALFANTNTLHTGSMLGSRDCHYISITFDSKMISGFPGSVIEQKYVAGFLSNPALSSILMDGSLNWHKDAISILSEIIVQYEHPSDCYELSLSILLQRFWLLLVTNLDLDISKPATFDPGYLRIRDMMSLMETNYMDKITLADFSKAIGLCEGECSRIFQKYMHIPLFTYLQQFRVEKSVPLLTDTALSITEIALRTGFSDSNYFSKSFAKYKHMTPSAYRKRSAHP